MLIKIDSLCNAMRGCTLAVLLVLSSMAVSCSQSVTGDVDWLIEVLDLNEGSVVADIGAGEGRLTLAIARHVGPTGQVYSSELGDDSVQSLRDVVASAPESNITVIEGDSTQTNLPKECCDALFLRRVYHHFDDPSLMNKSMWESLKPGGRIAVIDFVPRGSESEDPEGRDSADQHGVTAEAVVDELKDAGFTLVSKERRSDRDIYVVMQKER